MFRRKHASHSTEKNETEQQETKVKELRSALAPLTGRSVIYCTDACLRRYLQARNWNLDKSKKMLEDSLKWRSTYKPEQIRWPEVAVESETGKVYRANFYDREGRAVIVMTPARQNTKSHEGQIKHLVYMLENAVLNLREGQEQIVWLIDFTGWSLSNSVPIKTARETANVLQNHYPERLAIAFLFNPPMVFKTFWKVVKYFLDPKTFQKVNFVYQNNEESIKLMHKYFDPETLPLQFGGKNKVEYDHEEFSKMMIRDDLKTAVHWGLGEKAGHPELLANGHSATERAAEIPSLVAQAS